MLLNFLGTDVSTTVILTPGPVLDFLLANQNVREHCYIDWTKVNNCQLLAVNFHLLFLPIHFINNIETAYRQKRR